MHCQHNHHRTTVLFHQNHIPSQYFSLSHGRFRLCLCLCILCSCVCVCGRFDSPDYSLVSLIKWRSYTANNFILREYFSKYNKQCTATVAPLTVEQSPRSHQQIRPESLFSLSFRINLCDGQMRSCTNARSKNQRWDVRKREREKANWNDNERFLLIKNSAMLSNLSTFRMVLLCPCRLLFTAAFGYGLCVCCFIATEPFATTAQTNSDTKRRRRTKEGTRRWEWMKTKRKKHDKLHVSHSRMWML